MTVITESVRARPQSCHHFISLLLKNDFLFMVITAMEVFDHTEAFTLLSHLLYLKVSFFLGNNDPFVCCFRHL